MREKLDGQNLFKATVGRTDRGHGDSTHRSEQKADDFEKYKEKLQTELQKTARKDARMPDDRSRCKYAVFSKFLTMIDLLVSSGCPVDTIHDDFSAYYELRDVRLGRIR